MNDSYMLNEMQAYSTYLVRKIYDPKNFNHIDDCIKKFLRQKLINMDADHDQLSFEIETMTEASTLSITVKVIPNNDYTLPMLKMNKQQLHRYIKLKNIFI